MENASKALIMAGGVLIAVLIIGLFVYMFTSVSSNYRSEEDIKRTEEITEYNNQFESYNKKLIRGSEIISLINKAISNNEKYQDVPEYQIKIEFELLDPIKKYKWYDETQTDGTTKKVPQVGNVDLLSVGIHTSNDNNVKNLINNKDTLQKDAFNDLKRRVFNCEEVKYENGIINKMIFKEKRTNLEEGF